jgi:hypothetical protein
MSVGRRFGTRIRQARLAPIALLAVVTLLPLVGAPAAAAGAPVDAGGTTPAAVGTPAIGFDAVGTQSERRGWKHLGLRKDRYVVFNDGGAIETGFIRNKWPFLPAQFTFAVDAASIVFVGSRWKYVLVKGAEVVVFFDSGIVSGPMPYTSMWPFLPAALSSGLDVLTEHTENGLNVHMVSSGENFMIFNDNFTVLAQGLIRQRWPFLPPQFMSNLDDASIEPENGGWKLSFYKDNERIVFQDTGFVFEQTIDTAKWPFLFNFLIS